MNEKINRRRLIQGAGAVAASAALINAPVSTGWHQPRIRSRSPGGTTTNGANGPAIQAQLDSYTSANPNVKIERTYIPFADLKQKLLQGAAAGDLPDIVVIDNPDHQAFAALGVLEDLTDHVTAWGQASSYFEGPWNSTVFQGKNYGIPDNSNCLVLWSNDDLLAAKTRHRSHELGGTDCRRYRALGK